MFRHVLIPGRHHVLTRFQFDYLGDVLATGRIGTLGGDEAAVSPDAALVWAVTSADHQNTRRNPVPGHRREAAIEAFGTALGAAPLVFLIDDVPTTPRFADHVIKEIEVQSRGAARLTPADTIVACSTPEVIAMYEALGFAIAPMELVDRAAGTYSALRPWDVLLAMVAAGEAWATDPTYLAESAPASRSIIDRYAIGDHILAVHADPLLGDEGDLTGTRDYNTYARSMERGADRKYGYVAEFIRPGRIVDIGCATGQVIELMGDDARLRDSDLYGIEVARPLYETCLHRKRLGAFANENTFFYHRNILSGPLFAAGSVDTTLTMSLTHEIESYAGRADLRRFLSEVHRHTAPGGVFVNYDMVGPDEPDRPVLLWCDDADGVAAAEAGPRPAGEDELAAYLAGLSTRARFERFRADFRAAEGDQIAALAVEIDGLPLHRLRLADAMEFLTKKDYVDNWHSEMHEKFCFFSFAEWQTETANAGFVVDPRSYAFRNEWIVEHRWRDRTALYTEGEAGLEPYDFPVNAMVLVGVKT